MDTVIKRISEIEQSAVAVMDDAAATRKPLLPRWKKRPGGLTRQQMKKQKSCRVSDRR